MDLLYNIIDHRIWASWALSLSLEICQELQKDDEEWCYFMRYGKPRRNHKVPDASQADPDKISKLQQRAKIWKCLNATLSCIGIWFFIFILIVLFFIFHRIDNKPWYNVFFSFEDDQVQSFVESTNMEPSSTNMTNVTSVT